AGRIVGGGIKAETRQALDNIASVLQTGGSSLANAGSLVVYLRNTDDFAAMNEVYRTYWPKDPPARTTLRVSGPLALPDALIEITMVAVKDASRTAIVTPNDDGTPGTSNANLSAAIRVGNRLYLSGILASSATSEQNVTSQAGVALARVGRTLTAGGFGWQDVVDSVVYVPYVDQFSNLKTLYRNMLTKDFP